MIDKYFTSQKIISSPTATIINNIQYSSVVLYDVFNVFLSHDNTTHSLKINIFCSPPHVLTTVTNFSTVFKLIGLPDTADPFFYPGLAPANEQNNTQAKFILTCVEENKARLSPSNVAEGIVQGSATFERLTVGAEFCYDLKFVQIVFNHNDMYHFSFHDKSYVSRYRLRSSHHQTVRNQYVQSIFIYIVFS